MNKLLLYRQSVEPRPFERDCVRERRGEMFFFKEPGREKRKSGGEAKRKKKLENIRLESLSERRGWYLGGEGGGREERD